MGCAACASQKYSASFAATEDRKGIENDTAQIAPPTSRSTLGEDSVAIGESSDVPVLELDDVTSLPSTPDAMVPVQTLFSLDSQNTIQGLTQGRMIIEETRPLNGVYQCDVKDKLADGAYGTIVTITNQKTGQQRVTKSLRKKKIKQRWFEEMVRIQKLLDHPNICVLYEVFDDKLNFYSVHEFCSGGHLIDAISRASHFTERDAAATFRQILKAVAYIHQNCICHRDICPKNLMIRAPAEDPADLVPKIIDFGRAKVFREGHPMTEIVGAPDCMSPQVVLGSYSHLCDVWSCGVILFGLLTGAPPFMAETDEKIKLLVRLGAVHFNSKEWENVSDEGASLTKALLTFEEEDRPSAKDALNQPWFSENMGANVELKERHLHNLKSFAKKNKLEKAALHAIAQGLGSVEIEELRKVFGTLDKDNSGSVSLLELKDGIREDLPMFDKINSSKLLKVVDAIDVNGSREINYSEFLAAAMDQRCFEEEAVIWNAFRHFDKDGNGEIEREELHKVLLMEDLEAIVDHACIERIMEETDFNKDGRIDFHEFLCMMRHEKYVPRKFDKNAEPSMPVFPLNHPRDQPGSYLRPHAANGRQW